MKSSGYHLGRAHEYRVIDRLRADGYEIQRAASSKGIADVIAVKPGQVLLVSVKRTALPGPAERRELVRVARMLPGVAVPVIARGRTLLRITDDGASAKACIPFALDEVAS